MAAIVRDTGLQTGSAVGADSASFGTLPAVGNVVIVGSGVWQNADPAMIGVDDNQSNTYNRDVEREVSAVDSGASLFSTKVATSAGTFTVTIDLSGSAWVEWIAFEVSGLDGTTHLDKTGANNGAAATTANVTAASANATASGLAVSVAAVASNDTDLNISDTPPTGYTLLAANDNAQATQGFALAYKIYNAAETSSATFTHDSPATGWTAVIATYRDAAPAGKYFVLTRP